MGQAVLPMMGYIALQFFIVVIGFNLVRERTLSVGGVLKCWIFGQVALFALMEILAVAMIQLRWQLDALFLTYLTAGAVLFVLGVTHLKKIRWVKPKLRRLSPLAWVLLVLVLALILLQVGVYFFGVHLDQDDATWLAEANDALEYGDLMTRDTTTGAYQGAYSRDNEISSPWPLFYAVLARLLFGTRVSIIAHSVFAPVELLVLYGVYYLISRELFDKLEARLTFLLSVAVINQFYAGSVYTQAVFSMVRIWQGKAVVAGVMIPLVTYMALLINREDRTGDWLRLMAVNCAACLMSGMGISLTAFLIGIFGLYHILAYQSWKRIPLVPLAMLPSIITSLVYFFYRR